MEQKEIEVEKNKTTEQAIFWLKEGPNTFGSNTRNNFVFPESVANYAGILFLKNNVVHIRTAEYANIIHNKKSIDNQIIYQAGKGLILEVGQYRFQVVSKDGQLAVELK